MENTIKTYVKVPGGYQRKVDSITTEFIPDMCAKSFNAETGEVEIYKPVYEKKEPGKIADKPGVYYYRYENTEAPKNCDFSARLSYYGKHYFLTPLHGGIVLTGRGVKVEGKKYMVTENKFNQLAAIFKISYEVTFD